MEKKVLTTIFGIFILFSIISIASAQPPADPVINEAGVDINFPLFSVIEQGQEFRFHFHTTNASNGVFLDNNTLTCSFHLSNSSGHQIVQVNHHVPMEDDLIDWELRVLGGNFTIPGPYGWLVDCNSTAQLIGGSVQNSFEVTPTGTIITIAESFLYGFIILLIGIFLFFSVMGIRKTESGSWLIAYICLTYVLVYSIMGVCYLIASDYLWASPIIENIVYIVWFVMGVGFLPFIIVLSLYILGQEARAALEEDYIRQGHTREEARELSRQKKR